MNSLFKITDKFNITDVGTVYIIIINKSSNLKVNDVLKDMTGHLFQIKQFEMFRFTFVDLEDIEEYPIAITLNYLDNVAPCGEFLMPDDKEFNFIFCNHPLYQKQVDEDYEEEYDAASKNHPCALFSYEDLEDGKLSLYGEKISGLTIYRGWMMKPEMYQKFYELLKEKDIYLINSPDQYNKYHMLPGWYPEFHEVTPETLWEDHGNIDAIMNKAKKLSGEYMVKDYVKSRKHEWYDACYIRDIEDKVSTQNVIENFVKRQDDDLLGGIVLRKYEHLKSIGYHERSGMPISEEYRVFVLGKQILTIGDYWGNSRVNLSAEEEEWIKNIINRVSSNFVTADFARKEDGSLILIEFGDGQVSGLQQINPTDFYDQFDSFHNHKGDVKNDD